MNKIEIMIPFAGFYESYPMAAIEDALEYLVDGNDIELDVNYSNVFKEYAKEYTEQVAAYLEIPSLTFVKLTSPREYNFETDRIEGTISLEDLKKLLATVGEDKVRELAKQRFTSRSGFISFHDPNPDKWGNTWPWTLDEWQPVELETILVAAWEDYDNGINGDLEQLIYESMREKVSNIVLSNLSEDSYKLVDRLRT